jgi:methylglutaconyl-CoA hydratase
MMATFSACTKPIVARVQGAAFGGGVGLICVADIAIASTRARFAISEAKFGILPAVIGPYLLHAVGKRAALRLALTATTIDAEEACAIGLLHKVVDESLLDEAVEATIVELLGNGPLALAEIKQLFNCLGTAPIDEAARELTAHTISRVRASAEAREGFSAFINKRLPAWQTQSSQANYGA